MTLTEQHQALQNAADKIGLTIHICFFEDKRMKSRKYYATKDKNSVSPKLDYMNMQHYLLGWIRGSEL